MSDTRELKQYLHPITAIILPAAQSVVSAIAAGVTVASIAWAYKADNPLAAGGVAAGITFGLSWLLLLSWWRSRVEGTVQPTPQPVTDVVYNSETLRVELETPNGSGVWVDYLDWQGPRDILVLAAADLRSRNYETSNLGGCGKVLTRSQAEAVRDWLISKDLADWYRSDCHNQGWYINGVGRSVLRRLCHYGIASGMIDPPSPKMPVITEQAIYDRLHTHTDAQTPYQALPGKGIAGLPAVFPAGLIAAGDQADQETLDELWR